MSPEDLAELKLYMEETVARICAEVDAILSRNGLLDVIRPGWPEGAGPSATERVVELGRRSPTDHRRQAIVQRSLGTTCRSSARRRGHRVDLTSSTRFVRKQFTTSPRSARR